MIFQGRSSLTGAVTWPLLLVIASGCGRESFSVAPVSGLVTLDGQPLPDARVAFEPIAPPGEMLAGFGSYSKTDAEGRYTLSTIDEQSGAVVGRHRVTISTAVTPPRGNNADDVQPAGEKVPARYHDGREPLEFMVPEGGTENADLAMTSIEPVN